MHSAKLIADDLQPAAPVGSLIRPVLPIPCTEQVDRVKNDPAVGFVSGGVQHLAQQLRRADHPEGWLFVDQNGRGVLCRQCPLGAIGHPDALCPRCCTELIHDLHWVFLPCLFYSAPIVTRFCSAEKRLCRLEQTVNPCRFHFSRLCGILL